MQTSLSLRFNGHFAGEPGFPGEPGFQVNLKKKKILHRQLGPLRGSPSPFSPLSR